jgi:hypothetical protein
MNDDCTYRGNFIPRVTPLSSLFTEGKFIIPALRVTVNLTCFLTVLYHNMRVQYACISVFIKSDIRSRFLALPFYIFHNKGKET